MIIVVMGVAGAGKTTIGQMLARGLRYPFLDGDSLHPATNIEKMSSGIALSDDDRVPWLAAIRARMQDANKSGMGLVVACSALKQQYREFLGQELVVCWVYLKGSPEVILSRLEHRTSHYMKAGMLDSQFSILEEPADAIVVDVSTDPAKITDEILSLLNERCAQPDEP